MEHPQRKMAHRRYPYTLHRRKIYILPTRSGLVFMAALIGMVLGAVNHNNNFAFILAFLLAGMGFTSIFLTHRNLNGIRFISASTVPVFAGDPASIDIHLSHTRANARAVHFMFDRKNQATTDLVLDKSRRIVLPTLPEKRGLFLPNRLIISTEYPFGIFRAWANFDTGVECLVYPRPLPYQSQAERTPAEGPERGDAPDTGVDDFEGLRSYQPGDSLRRIDWKAFSRGRGLLVKSFEGRIGASVVIDWGLIPERDLEKKLSILCHLVIEADRAGLPYGLRLPTLGIAPSRGNAHRRDCLKALALFELDGNSR